MSALHIFLLHMFFFFFDVKISDQMKYSKSNTTTKLQNINTGNLEDFILNICLGLIHNKCLASNITIVLNITYGSYHLY